jgi:phosphatidylserine decarboxylase
MFAGMPLYAKILNIHLLFWICLFLSLIPIFFVYRFWFFFRDPKRKIPEGNNIVSPADGYVLYIKKITSKGEVPISIKKGKKIFLKELMDDPKTKYNLVIGIFMTPFSVHYNRIPFSGIIKKNIYRSVKQNKSMMVAFLNLIFNIKPYSEKAEYIYENERNTLTIKNKRIDGAVVQIASTWVDNIKNEKLKPGQKVLKGYKFGMIRMGSQCDLFLKIKGKYNIKVNERDYVKAGSSILIDLID